MAPVITIDGPASSGKGTVAQLVAQQLGFHYLDSGALYRLVAFQALRTGADLADAATLANLARLLPVTFAAGETLLEGENVGDAIRAEAVGNAASVVASVPEVRSALVDRQRAFARAPGLVADGRDMGTVIFPDAFLKVYLTASAETRAERRYKQLMAKGMCASIDNILNDIRQRDARDSGRSVAPLQKSDDALLLDSSQMTVDEVVQWVVKQYLARVAH